MTSGGEKIRLLRRLFSEGSLDAATLEELKLYLMLLVVAEPLQEEQTVGLKTLRRALGRKISLKELLDLGRQLEGRSLARLSFDPVAKRPQVRYRILLPKGWVSPAPEEG
jgi:hypothetical protein